jgi:hypothetical protein
MVGVGVMVRVRFKFRVRFSLVFLLGLGWVREGLWLDFG